MLARDDRPAYATLAEWGKHKDLITRLYISDGMHLQQVIEFMEQMHNFRATMRMYKSRFTQWSLRKYRISEPHPGGGRRSKSSNDRGAGAQAQAQAVEIRRAGPELVRHSSRQSHSITQTPASTTVTMQLFHKDDNSLMPLLPIRLKAPEEVYCVEAALHAVLAYTDSCHEKNDVHSRPLQDAGEISMSTFPISLDELRKTMGRQQDSGTFFRYMDVTFDLLTDIIKRNDPLLPQVACTMIMATSQPGYSGSSGSSAGRDIAIRAAEYSAGLSEIVLGSSHPATVLFRTATGKGGPGTTLFILGSQRKIIERQPNLGSPYWGAAMLLLTRQLWIAGILSYDITRYAIESTIKQVRAEAAPEDRSADSLVAIAQWSLAAITLEKLATTTATSRVPI